MLTIKNSKVFKKIQSLKCSLSSGEEIFKLLTDRNNEYYISNLPVIDLARVNIFSDRIVFLDYCSQGVRVFRDNSFSIEEE